MQLSGDITVDLASLKVPYKRSVRKLSLWYEQDNITNKQDQRSFSYYYEDNTKIQNHFPQSKPTALDLFAGVGGMGLGLKNAGFHVKYAVENNPLTAATLQANLLNSNSGSTNGTQVFVEDVKTFLKRCREEHPCYPSIGDVNHIHASTPCKGFSRANRNGGKDDLRNNQVRYFINLENMCVVYALRKCETKKDMTITITYNILYPTQFCLFLFDCVQIANGTLH